MEIGDKYSGSIVGLRHTSRGIGRGLVGADAHAASSVDELLQAAEDESVLLQPVLCADGALRREAVRDPLSAARGVMQMGQMASMLRDHWRCESYSRAIQACISEFHRTRCRPPRVLDIGAGTGLLSLLAASHGAACVVGVEQWAPMCNVAQSVLAQNFKRLPKDTSVSLFPVHSTELRVDSAGSGPAPSTTVSQPFDIIVSEIVDSALLGEGMIPALLHSYSELCSSDSADTEPMCVPRSATVFAQLVHCPLASLWHCTDGLAVRQGADFGSVLLGRTDWSPHCDAAPVAVPVHLAAVPGLRPVTGVFEASTFDFTQAGLKGFNPDTTSTVSVAAAADAPPEGANAIVFWWNLELWPGVSYSTAPGAYKLQGWQDHWVQCMLPLPRPVRPSTGELFTVVMSMPGGTRISFDVAQGGATVWQSKLAHKKAIRSGAVAAPGASDPPPLYLEPQPCTCGLHTITTPDRRWMLRDSSNWVGPLRSGIDDALARAIRSASMMKTQSLIVLCLGDASLCAVLTSSSPAWATLCGDQAAAPSPLLVAVDTTLQGTVHTRALLDQLAAQYEAGHPAPEHSVYSWDSSTPLAPAVSEAIAEALELVTDAAVPLVERQSPRLIDALLIEPFFTHMQHRPLWCAFAAYLRCSAVAPLLSQDCEVLPSSATVWAQAIQLHDLHRNYGPVGSPCGFDHAPFDAAQAGYERHVFSYPLWQYAHTLIGTAQPVVGFDYALCVKDSCGGSPAMLPRGTARVPARDTAGSGIANAVVLFVSYSMAPRQRADLLTPTRSDAESVASASTWLPGGEPCAWRQDVVFLPHDPFAEGAYVDVSVSFAEEGRPVVKVQVSS